MIDPVIDPLIDIEIEDRAWGAAEPLVRLAAAAALGERRDSLVILLTDDTAVAALNAQFRDKAGPTNVLSFPAAANLENHLGDIALAYGVCAREAVDQGKALNDHLQHLVIHGVLHLLGYDHQDAVSAARMESLETSLLASLGIADPYILTDDRHDRV